MISKELLSEVLEIEIVDYAINENQVRINQLWHEDNPLNRALELINTSYGCRASINIYELANKCKEWATFKNGKNIITERDVSGAYSYIIFMLGITIHNEYLDDTTRILANFKADTEPEAIFKACQWILENK